MTGVKLGEGAGGPGGRRHNPAMATLLWLLLQLVLAGMLALMLLVLADEWYVLRGYLQAPMRYASAGLPPGPREDWLRCAVLVAAHDEAAALPRLLAALRSLDYPAARWSLHVVADRCSDDTAAIARAGGAFVLERLEGAVGKGPALNDLLEAMRDERDRFDLFVILDADGVPERGWLRGMVAEHLQGAPVVQGATFTRAAHGQTLPVFAAYANRAQDVVQRGRRARGLQSLLVGNNLLIARGILAELDWRCAWNSPTEEEIRLPLLRAGTRMSYAPGARLHEETPSELEALGGQRSRWFRDHLLFMRHAPEMAWAALKARDWHQLEAVFSHLVLTSHTVELMGFLAAALLMGLLGGLGWGLVATLALAARVLHALVLARCAGVRREDIWHVAARFPQHAAGWLVGIVRHLFGRRSDWVHTRHRG